MTTKEWVIQYLLEDLKKYFDWDEGPNDIQLWKCLREEDAIKVINNGDSRWWRNETIIIKLGDKFIGFSSASANRDESVLDLGWAPYGEWIKEYKQVEKTVIEYVSS